MMYNWCNFVEKKAIATNYGESENRGDNEIELDPDVNDDDE